MALRERESAYDSEFSLSDDSSVPLKYDDVNVRDPVVVPVLLLIPPERVSPLREGDMDDVDVPVCESPSKDAEFGPLRDIVEATMSVPVPDTMSTAGSAVTVPVIEVRPRLPENPDVPKEVEYQLVLEVLLSVPLAAVKKRLSLEEVFVVSELRVLELPRDCGGGVKDTSRPSCGPLDIVTGEPSPKGIAARPIPKPRPPLEFRAILSALLKPSSKSVIELVRRRELMRLGGITRGSA